MDQPPSLDSTYGSLIVTSRFLHLNRTSFPQVRCSFHRRDSWRSVGCAARPTLFCSDLHVFCTGYTEVIVRALDHLTSPLTR